VVSGQPAVQAFYVFWRFFFLEVWGLGRPASRHERGVIYRLRKLMVGLLLKKSFGR
jgi:hypothetical protein